MVDGRRVLAVSLLSLIAVSTIATMAATWWQVGLAGAGAGALAGAAIGSVVPGLGTAAGGAVGALLGFFTAELGYFLGQAPVSTNNQTNWNIYAYNVFQSIYSESLVVVDNQINQLNLLQQAQLPFVITAQKWEQVNYNVNDSPTSPYEVYQMLSQTGFLNYAAQLVGGSQTLWIGLQQQINTVDAQIGSHGLSISYNVNPNSTVTAVYAGYFSYSTMPTGIYIIVVGSATWSAGAAGGQVYEVTPNNQYIKVNSTTLNAGMYYVTTASSASVNVNPNDGMVLAFLYNASQSKWTPVSWSYNVPSSISLKYPNGTVISKNIPQPSEPLPLVVEQVAVAMIGAAQAEYTTLKALGFDTASQIPPNYELPTLNLNNGNFTPYNSSIQAYNLYMEEYLRELMQMQQTLSNLSASGRLYGLQSLTYNFSNPLSLYGQYGGFITNGTIVLPNGQTLSGMFLIQPYGGPLSLGPNGGTIGSGGAVAYQLIPLPNGQYALGTMYTLPPNTVVNGKVSNPGTLYPYSNPQPATYTATPNYTNPYYQSASNAFSNLVNYLASHPIVLLLTIAFVLIIVVIIIRSLA